jgi:AcrR family transcriptional regulator
MDTSAPTTRLMRADARRNYERIVVVASEAFARDGPDASLEAIAREAKVGSATLHRHFPHRYALMEAAYWGQIEALCAEGRALLDAHDPLGALVRWLRDLISLAAERRLASALLASERDKAEGFFEACHTAIRKVGNALWRRATEAGDVRPDIDLEDVLRLANAISVAVEGAEDGSERADRLLDVLIRGISARR